LERNQSLEPQFSPQLLEPGQFGAGLFQACPRCAADDDDRQVLLPAWDAGNDLGHGPQQGVDALQGLNAPHKEDDASCSRQPQVSLGLVGGDRVEETQIHAAGHDGDFGCVGAVEPDHLGSLQRCGSYQPVSQAHHLSLAFNAALRFPLLRTRGNAILHMSQGMEHLDDGRAPCPPQVARSQT